MVRSRVLVAPLLVWAGGFPLRKLRPDAVDWLMPRTVGEARPRYGPFSWGHFRRRRFEGDFADEGKPEIQIADYLLD